jgi:hypothetical protein
VIAVLLAAVPAHRAGTASGLLNTSRQLGGALAVAVFGALLAAPAGLSAGMRVSLLLGAAVAATAAFTAAGLPVPASPGTWATADYSRRVPGHVRRQPRPGRVLVLPDAPAAWAPVGGFPAQRLMNCARASGCAPRFIPGRLG